MQVNYFSHLLSTSVVFWTFLPDLHLMGTRMYRNKLKICIRLQIT